MGLHDYRAVISVIISISASALAIFSADEGCRRPNPGRKDMKGGFREELGMVEGECGTAGNSGSNILGQDK